MSSAAVSISDGVLKQVLRPGVGLQIEKGDDVTCHIRAGITATGKKFWCSRDRGQSPFTFKAGTGRVIAGWDEGCLTMKRGEIAKFTIDPKKAYGESGFPAFGIEPNSSVDLQVEILSVRKPQP